METRDFKYGFSRHYLPLIIAFVILMVCLVISGLTILGFVFFLLSLTSIFVLLNSFFSHNQLLITEKEIIVKYPIATKVFQFKDWSRFEIVGKGLFARIVAYNHDSNLPCSVVQNRYNHTLLVILSAIYDQMENKESIGSHRK